MSEKLLSEMTNEEVREALEACQREHGRFMWQRDGYHEPTPEMEAKRERLAEEWDRRGRP